MPKNSRTILTLVGTLNSLTALTFSGSQQLTQHDQGRGPLDMQSSTSMGEASIQSASAYQIPASDDRDDFPLSLRTRQCHRLRRCKTKIHSVPSA